ncbi:ATP-binding cassette domain-containing protein, partial [Streptomyces sp. SID3212]|uniref:ATP-binding cassette domain-containing protein n=1 Tax=Streptomyces sp. SID3212 TaxID=2690259 RepID=UPI00136CF254
MNEPAKGPGPAPVSGPGPGPGPVPGRPVLALRDVSTSFGAVRALQEVSLGLYAGEAHALAGENGAGKSTLIK